ncbi:cytochrome c [Paraflavisolibacter sp. H34]|uniref:c-type cytochrome n=1 Tax=Huijunlia imazamoxiresistens TaxID=3127457 RepID=UPI00301AFACB
MKKILIAALIFPAALALQFCSSSKKAAKATSKVTYEAQVKPVFQATCTPCHFPPQGNKTPYDTYASVKKDVDEILVRIRKNPGERGFMPARHAKLPDATIQLIAQWKADGLLEK